MLKLSRCRHSEMDNQDVSPQMRQINQIKELKMKKTFAGICLMASLAVLATPSYAMGSRPHHRDNIKEGSGHGNPNGGRYEHVGSNSVPEIDAAGASLALALLGGIVAISRERRKKP
jgi:hypothetical protein